jgi:hypothetical protein
MAMLLAANAAAGIIMAAAASALRIDNFIAQLLG